MRFVVLVYQDEHLPDDGPQPQRDARHADLVTALDGTGLDLVATELLHGPEAVTTCRRHGTVLTLSDGPAPARVEQLGAVVVLEAPDVDAVTGVLGRLPEHTLEIHPVVVL